MMSNWNHILDAGIYEMFIPRWHLFEKNQFLTFTISLFSFKNIYISIYLLLRFSEDALIRSLIVSETKLVISFKLFQMDV